MVIISVINTIPELLKQNTKEIDETWTRFIQRKNKHEFNNFATQLPHVIK